MGSDGGWQTKAVERLGITVPIVGAPMGGGPSTPALVAAVSEAGGLRSLGGGYPLPRRLPAALAAVRGPAPPPPAVHPFVPCPGAAARRGGPTAPAAPEAHPL